MTTDGRSDQWRVAIQSVLLGWLFVVAGVQANAESALDLLSGFDTQRLAGCYPVDDSASAGEMSRLLFRLRKADADAIAARNQGWIAEQQIGDVGAVEGTILSIRQYKVPESLADVLDLQSFQEISLKSSHSDESISLFAPTLVGNLATGDTVKANAILIVTSESGPVAAAGRVAWTPATATSIGWQLLAQEGVDLSRIAEAASRNRRPLESADGDAFYSLLTAAKNLDDKPLKLDGGFDQRLIEPEFVEPVALLQNPAQYAGQWIRINASTVRITKVNVTDPDRRAQLGQDYYFQIDASGDLGKTIVQLERSEGDTAEPIRMGGTYPMSLVAAQLPDFLAQSLDHDHAVVSMISYPVSIDGFFFRLWSYSNEFMTREGGGKQVGPLIVVSHWKSMAPAEQAEDGVQVIGYALALGIFAAIIATLWWTRRNAREDAKIRRSALGSTKIEI